jgi:hypothetical protein
MFTAGNARPWRELVTLNGLAIGVLVVALLLAVSTLGPTSPGGLAILALAGGTLLTLALRSAPLLLVWAVPVSMCFFVYLPLLHFEALTLLLFGIGAIPRLRTARLKDLKLDAVQWKWLLLLLAMLPGYLAVVNQWRFFGTLKMYVVGWIGFELARRLSRTFGREAVLWGPAFFCLITTAQVVVQIVRSGVPAFKVVAMRTAVTDLGWAHANGVASALIVCTPALMYLVRISAPGSWRRSLAISGVVSVLVTSLLVAARGPFLIIIGYFLATMIRLKRSAVAALAGVGVVALLLAFSPIGQGLVERFTGPEVLMSAFFRVQAWDVAYHRGVEHFPWGIGAGQGQMQNDELLDEDPHNYLISLFSEVGLPATLIWLWLFATLWKRGARLRARRETALVGRALVGTLGISLINALFDPTLISNTIHLLFWWVLGALEAGQGGPETALEPETAAEMAAPVRS